MRTGAAIILASAVAMGGCSSWNFNRYHSELSVDELKSMAASDFPLGSDRQSVRRRVEDLGMELSPQEPADSKTLNGYIDPPWWYRKGVFPTSQAQLTFYFMNERLDGIRFSKLYWDEEWHEHEGKVGKVPTE